MQFKMLIRSFFENLIRNKSLRRLNQQSSNNIRSIYASPKAIIGRQITVMEGTHISADCSVDSFTYIGYNTFITKTNLGSYNSIANNVHIGQGEHPLEEFSTSVFLMDNPYTELTRKECIIEHDVWIGTGSVIRRGVKIGTGAVVGANSFVNCDIPPYAVFAGSPAKLLRYRLPEKEIVALLTSEWWKQDPESAKQCIKKIKANLETFTGIDHN